MQPWFLPKTTELISRTNANLTDSLVRKTKHTPTCQRANNYCVYCSLLIPWWLLTFCIPEEPVQVHIRTTDLDILRCSISWPWERAAAKFKHITSIRYACTGYRSVIKTMHHGWNKNWRRGFFFIVRSQSQVKHTIYTDAKTWFRLRFVVC